LRAVIPHFFLGYHVIAFIHSRKNTGGTQMPWFSWFRRSRSQSGSSRSDKDFEVMGQRRYVRKIPYVLPKDLTEVNRLDFQHFMLRQIFLGNFLAPITNPLSILDSACGTGRWAMEMAVQFPNANVVGLDIVQPEHATLGFGVDAWPENFVFLNANILERLPFEDATFDYVHQRLVTGAIPSAQWPGLIRELVRVTRPGGWIELVEGNPFPTKLLNGQAIPERAWAINKLSQWAYAILGARGIDPSNTARLGEFLQQAGIPSVTVRKFPLSPSARSPLQPRVKSLLQTDILAIMTAIQGPVVGLGIATKEEYEAALAHWPQEIRDFPIETPFYIAYGQRPLR
jgi:ubiquinone/menaquinone biosynthesis C-methylase UbiE